MKKIIILILLIIFSLSYGQTAPTVGDGSAGSPYQIATFDNLLWIQADNARWGFTYIQTANITALPSGSENWDRIGDNGDPFTGSYDGQSNTIDGLFIITGAGSTNQRGLFGVINGATLENIGIINISLTNEGTLGALVGESRGGTLTNCYSTGTVVGSGAWVGGLIGFCITSGTTISDCYSECTVTNTATRTGGLIGYIEVSSTVTDCYATGSVTGEGSTGGFIGKIYAGSINKCYSTGNVSGGVSGSFYPTGGFVGYAEHGTINECYSRGNSEGYQRVGGFVGYNKNDTRIENSYSLGDISRKSGSSDLRFGGFVGYNNGATTENCYSLGSVTSDGSINKGFVGENTGIITACFFDATVSNQTTDSEATAENTTNMQTETTFTTAGWNFTTIWEIQPGNYPSFLASASSVVETISSGEISISIRQFTQGIEVSSISRNGTELLNTSTIPDLFTLDISGSSVGAFEGWGDVNTTNTGSELNIQFSNPTNTIAFPTGLVVTVSIATNNEKSEWDISVAGLDNKSLLEVTFPKLNIKANGSDTFLRPFCSGQEIDNPLASGLNTDLLYPRGSGATMQLSAYYNNSYGIYLTPHDPTAALKSIKTIATGGGLEYFTTYPIPNKTVNGNDWQLPGYFALYTFDGNWYEAAQIYRAWASSEANYWPQTSVARTERQNKLGSIGAWAYMQTKNMATARSSIEGFHNVVDVPVGILWYDWSTNVDGADENYPNYFPEEPGMIDVVTDMQASGDIFIVPYTNGRLFDVTLPDYNTNGEPYATKDENGDVNTQTFSGNTFAVMCPTQTTWQNTLIDIQDQLTNRIGVKGSYLDQVCHALGLECMDETHGHDLGGGNFWREGYNSIVTSIQSTQPSDVFITAEGAAEYLNNELDGCYTLAWIHDNLVPVYPAVYTGQIQTFGIKSGTSNYDTPQFYAKLATIFNFGIQVGGITTSIHSDSRAIAEPARAYVRKLAKLRYKLREYMSFGKMLKPLIDVSGMGTITSDWLPGEQVRNVTVSVLQQSFWENSVGNKEVIIFTNASKTETLNFTLNYSGTAHGLTGNLKIQKVTAETDDAIVNESNSFTRNITLNPLEEEAYIIDPVNGLPVELTSFTAKPQNGVVELLWETATEVNNYGFEIERSFSHSGGNTSAKMVWNKVGFVEGHGNSNSVKEYSFIDTTIADGYRSYRLKQIDNDGGFKYSDIVIVNANKLLKTELFQNYPNPFNPTTEISFSIRVKGITSLEVYNILGQKVATIVNKELNAGSHKYQFDASRLTSGIYFYKLQSTSYSNIKKMLLIK